MYHANTAGWSRTAPSDPSTCPLQILIVTPSSERRERLAACLDRQRCRAVAMDHVPPPARLRADQFNLLILDVQQGIRDGFDVLRRVRAQSDIPIIMMSGEQRDDIDCVMGLELGADDFVESPINPRELLARGRAILRRHGAAHAPTVADQRGGYRFSGWELRRRDRSVTDPHGRPVALSKNEYTLLLAFLEAPGRPLSRIHLMRATRPHEDIHDRSVDVQVLRLRKKLEADRSKPRMIRTDRNFGYIFEATVEPLF